MVQNDFPGGLDCQHGRGSEFPSENPTLRQSRSLYDTGRAAPFGTNSWLRAAIAPPTLSSSSLRIPCATVGTALVGAQSGDNRGEGRQRATTRVAPTVGAGLGKSCAGSVAALGAGFRIGYASRPEPVQQQGGHAVSQELPVSPLIDCPSDRRPLQQAMERVRPSWDRKLIFLSQVLSNFGTVGAIAPSSPPLAKAIVRPLQDRPKRPISVLEAGAGTGGLYRPHPQIPEPGRPTGHLRVEPQVLPVT